MKRCCVGKRASSMAVLLLWFTCVSISAENNTLELKSTFKGNQEQPKVLYIVPWQAIEAPPASYRPVSSLIAENFQLVDREEFQRNVHFSGHLQQAERAETERYMSTVSGPDTVTGTAEH